MACEAEYGGCDPHSRRPPGGWKRLNSSGLKSSDDTALTPEEVVGAGVVPAVDSRL
jgi:hypothetical protein